MNIAPDITKNLRSIDPFRSSGAIDQKFIRTSPLALEEHWWNCKIFINIEYDFDSDFDIFRKKKIGGALVEL